MLNILLMQGLIGVMEDTTRVVDRETRNKWRARAIVDVASINPSFVSRTESSLRRKPAFQNNFFKLADEKLTGDFACHRFSRY